jgi:hypothetical protein
LHHAKKYMMAMNMMKAIVADAPVTGHAAATHFA